MQAIQGDYYAPFRIAQQQASKRNNLNYVRHSSSAASHDWPYDLKPQYFKSFGQTVPPSAITFTAVMTAAWIRLVVRPAYADMPHAQSQSKCCSIQWQVSRYLRSLLILTRHWPVSQLCFRSLKAVTCRVAACRDSRALWPYHVGAQIVKTI